ncbi:MAG TPA: cytochrome c [Terriglobales bacterium]|jgi:mono/diheme cytochrome c family protein|nr:cytochrome c [Terriglobales bacterium]
MRDFMLGVIITLLVLIVGGLAIAMLGLLPTNADSTPPRIERRIAMSAVDASMERHAPRVTNPTPPTDENLIDGMKIYTMNCAGCHGALDNKPSPLQKSFYPPPPQLIMSPLDDPEWHIYYAVRTGIRYTGMPAWNQALTDPEIWKVTAFLSRIEKLPPAVQDYWKKSVGIAPPAAGPEGEGHGQHHD